MSEMEKVLDDATSAAGARRLDRESGNASDLLLSLPRTLVETAVTTARQLLNADFCAFIKVLEPSDGICAIAVDGITEPEVSRLVDRWCNSPKTVAVPCQGYSSLDKDVSVWFCLEPVVDLGGRNWGMLLVGFSENLNLQSREQLLIRTLAAHLGLLIESYTRQVRNNAGYEALFEIGTQIQAEVNLDKVLRLIVRKARDLLGTETSWLALVREDTEYLYIRMTEGIRTKEFFEMYVPVGVGIGGIAVEQRRTVVVPDYREHLHHTLDFVRETVIKEGIVSMLCAPMFRGDKMVGALYVANRSRTQFTPTDVVLLSTLATQASIAIENARLYKKQEEALVRLRDLNSLLESKNDLLEQSFAIHRQLTAAVLAGNGFEEVAAILARLIRRPLIIQQEILPPFLSYYSPSGEKVEIFSTQLADFDLRIVSPIMAGDEVLGRILVIGTRKLSDIEQRALEHGSTVLALELLKQRATRDVEWRLQGELLEELLESEGELNETLIRRAERMGFAVDQPHHILVGQLDRASDEVNASEDLMTTARRAVGNLGTVLGLKRGDRIILAVPAEAVSGKEAARLIQKAWGKPGNPSISVGVSGQVGGSRTFAAAYKEALACLQLAQMIRAQGAVITYDELGPLRFLLHVEDPHYAVDFVRQKLGALAEYDRSHSSELLPTLRAYLESDGHHPSTAKKCFIHPSTLKYRLGRISDILGTPVTDPDLRFELRLAFRILDLFEACGRRIL